MARRSSNGEGTLYQRKDGRWEGAIYVLTTSGARKRVHVYSPTRAEAHKKLTEAKAKNDQGVPIPDRTWKVGDYLDYWLGKAKIRPLTYKRHESVVRLYLKPSLGKYRLDRLSVQALQDVLDGMQADGVTSATIHQSRKVLSAALTYAVKKQWLITNVARLVDMPEYRPKEAKHWPIAETARFLEAARKDPLYALFVLFALYGLRSGEARGILWRDVDFDRGVLRIRLQVQRIGGKLQLAPLKTRSSTRDEPLQEIARKILEERRRAQAAARLAAGLAWQGSGTDDDLVFTTKTGRPLEAQNVNRSFMRICRESGITRITLHGLRHSNATAQKSLDVHDRDIQAILGHSDVKTTGIYEHIDMDSKRKALGKVESALFGSQQDADGNARCRQMLPSNKKKLHLLGEVFSGGSSQTRTGDTRLFRPVEATLRERLTSIDQVTQARTRAWKLGAVAVNLAVKPSSPNSNPNPRYSNPRRADSEAA